MLTVWMRIACVSCVSVVLAVAPVEAFQSDQSDDNARNVTEPVLVRDAIVDYNEKLIDCVEAYNAISAPDPVIDRAVDLREKLAKDPKNAAVREDFSAAQMAVFDLVHQRQIDCMKSINELGPAFDDLKKELSVRIDATSSEEVQFKERASSYQATHQAAEKEMINIAERLSEDAELTDDVAELVHYQQRLIDSARNKEMDTLTAQGSVAQQRQTLEITLRTAARTHAQLKMHFSRVEMQAAELEVAAEAATVVARGNRNVNISDPLVDVAGKLSGVSTTATEDMLNKIRLEVQNLRTTEVQMAPEDPEFKTTAREILRKLKAASNEQQVSAEPKN